MLIRRVSRLAGIGTLLTSFLVTSCGRFGSAGSDDGSQLSSAIRRTVQNATRPEYVTRDRDGARLWKLTRTFYQHRDFAPAWIQDRVPKPQMDALTRAIHAAYREGLDPELYSASLLDLRKQEASRGFLT